jgi:RNA polymerase sigma-70 factor (ECF subfamily)
LKKELAAMDSDEMIDLPDDVFASPASSVEADERLKFLHQQIDALPESYRLMITLRFQQELSYAEIAQVADVPLGTVKTMIYRARERLREALRQYEEEPVWTP